LTILSLLKPGDTIRLHWLVDAHTNDYARQHGLHGDALRLEIIRKDKVLTFHLTTSFCPNNSARMFKFAPALLQAA